MRIQSMSIASGQDEPAKALKIGMRQDCPDELLGNAPAGLALVGFPAVSQGTAKGWV